MLFFTLFTLAALLTTPIAANNAPVQDPARLVPANTIFYVGTPSLQASADVGKASAMRKILDEPEVRAFLQKPVGAADKALQELIAQSGLPAEATPKISLAGMLGGDGGGVPIGQVFVALTHVSLPAPGADGEGEPDVGFVLGIEMKNESDLGVVKALWSLVEAPETAGTHAGRSYVIKKGEDGPPLALAFIDRLAVLSLSEKSLRAVLDNATAGKGTSLADTAEYQQAAGLGGGLRADSSTWLFRVGPMADMLRSVLSIVVLTHEDHAELGKLSAVIDQLGLGAIHWMGGEGHREPDGRVVSVLGVSTASNATGLVGKCLASETPVDLALLSGVPGNCQAMSAMGVDWLPHVYDFLVSAFETFEPEEAAAVLGQIQTFMGGANLRDDLLANPHGVLLTYTLPPEGFPGQPNTIFRVPLRDPPRFVKAMKAVVTGVAGAIPDMKDLAITDSEHEGRPFYEIDLSATPGAMFMMQPAFATDGDTLVMCLQSAKALRTALNGVQGSGSLADNSEFMAFAKSLAAKGQLTELSFSDNAQTFSSIYGQVAGPVSMMAGMFGELPVDFSLLPTEQAIIKHLGYSYAGGSSMEGGLSVHRSVSEFALGDFVPLLLTAGVLGVQAATGGAYEDAAVVEVSPTERVQADLQQLSAAMTVYKISQGAYPKELADLVKPLPDYEEGCLGKPELPLDPWGNGYRFRLNEKKKPFLWSAGPNGLDEGGAGDDVAKK